MLMPQTDVDFIESDKFFMYMIVQMLSNGFENHAT